LILLRDYALIIEEEWCLKKQKKHQTEVRIMSDKDRCGSCPDSSCPSASGDEDEDEKQEPCQDEGKCCDDRDKDEEKK